MKAEFKIRLPLKVEAQNVIDLLSAHGKVLDFDHRQEENLAYVTFEPADPTKEFTIILASRRFSFGPFEL